MRIIGGNLKGKKISYIKNQTTRPLRDFVRESLFNVITHSKLVTKKIKNSAILDVYCGVGSFGIEALSREAKFVTFIDKDKKAIEILRKNLHDINKMSMSTILDQDIYDVLNKIKQDTIDIIFLDPPYKNDELIDLLLLIKKLNILKKKNLIIIHRESSSKKDFGDKLNIILEKKYGRSKLIMGFI